MSCVFPPEPVVSSRTSFDVARDLTARGHDVTVITAFPNRPAGRLYAGYRRAPFRREVKGDGFRIVRCFSFLSRRSSMVSRLAENVSFGLMSALALAAGRKPAVVYANTWPLFASALVAFVARVRSIPIVFSVQDLYPESLMSQRRAGSGLIGRVLMAVDRWIMRGAAAVVVISERFAEQYRRTRGIDPTRIYVVPNWLSAEGTEEAAGVAQACRDRHGIPGDAFLLVYGGNVGVSAAVESVIEAVGDVENVHLLVAGEGASLDNCRRLAERIAPERIHFENPWSDTMGVLHAADVVILPTRTGQSAASVPSKLISYLFSGRPVLAVALEGSDTAETILASGAGITVPPDDHPALMEAIRSMERLSLHERQRMGSAGRAWAMANLTAEACLPRLVKVIEGVRR